MEIQRYRLLSEPERNFAGDLVKVMSIETHEIDTSILDGQPDGVEDALLIAVDNVRNLKASNKELEDRMTTLGQELQSANAKLALSEGEVQQVNADCRNLKVHNRALENELTQQKTLNEELCSKLKSMEEEVVSLRQKLSKAASNLRTQKQLLDSKDLEIQELSSRPRVNFNLGSKQDQIEYCEALYQMIAGTQAYREVKASTAAKYISIRIKTLGHNPIGRQLEWVRENSTSHMSIDAFNRKTVQLGTSINRTDLNNPRR